MNEKKITKKILKQTLLESNRISSIITYLMSLCH